VIRTDLLGWTLAELALALLFAFFAAFVPSYVAEVQRIKRLEAEAKKAVTAADVEKLRKENSDLRSGIEASRKDLKSKLTPPCAELDKNSTWLFTATVTSRDSFDIEGEAFTLDGIERKYAEQLKEAKRRGCIEKARIYIKAGMSAGDFDYAYKRLGSDFYLASLGEKRP
jgi:Tfp pilus assembly protein PilE